MVRASPKKEKSRPWQDCGPNQKVQAKCSIKVKKSKGMVEILELTVKECAALQGCSEQYVRKQIQSGKIKAREVSRHIGTGIQYLIPLESLELKYRRKWERQHRKEGSCADLLMSIEQLSISEREEASRWKEVLNEWEAYRNQPGRKKEEADEEFVRLTAEKYPELELDRRKLYRRKTAYKKYGYAGLVDKRGKHNNHSKAIPDDVWNVFEFYYLDESRKTVTECVKLTQMYFKRHELDMPALPDRSTFARGIVERIPAPVLQYERFGDKAYHDKCGMYINRYYDDLYSNDIWVCDNHTFDIFIDDGESVKPTRVYLTGFLDVRSRKMVGWYVTMNPCSDATLYALRRGIDRYGIPKHILADNGREFLTHDIGGRGHRKSLDWGHEAPTILQNLQIDFSTAMVRNAKAKIIERAFREVKECFSRLFDGYTGGTTAERPERLKKTGKYAVNFTPIESFVTYVDKYIEGIFNFESSNGIGMNGRSRNEVYAANLIEKRTASPAELNLMLLRNSKPVKVQREGVALRMYDTYVYFNSAELLFNHIGERVYFRFNPDDLKEVRVYDEQDRFLCTAVQQGKLSYYASKDEVREKMKELREFDRMVRSYKKQKGVEADHALDLVMWQAEQNLQNAQILNPAVITPIRYAEEKLGLPAAVGQEAETPIDYSRMLEKYKEERDKE